MKPIVKWWLLTGLILVFFQIFIGGVTRLTGSGLSITKWEIVTGTLPPLSQTEWEEAFDLYKATPQYEKINEGMSMGQFKFIYFWEYFHRLWARAMGFIFLFPFLFFLYKGWLPKSLTKRLLILVALAMVVAIFGWIMVASGLTDRPWVNAYKLTWHLSLALIVFGYLAWIVFNSWAPERKGLVPKSGQKLALTFLIIVCIQIMLGGVMSGAKAGLAYPTWPDMNGQWIPDVLLSPSNYKWSYFIDYDRNTFFPAFIQFMHRSMAYVALIVGAILIWKFRSFKHDLIKRSLFLMSAILGLQIFLGIWTVVSCKGTIPVALGVSHQAVAVFLLLTTLWLVYLSSRPSKTKQPTPNMDG